MSSLGNSIMEILVADCGRFMTSSVVLVVDVNLLLTVWFMLSSIQVFTFNLLLTVWFMLSSIQVFTFL